MAKPANLLEKRVLFFLAENRLRGSGPTNQAELASLMSKPPQAVSKILKGNPTLSSITEIADALGKDVYELFAPVDPKPRAITLDEALDAIDAFLSDVERAELAKVFRLRSK